MRLRFPVLLIFIQAVQLHAQLPDPVFHKLEVEKLGVSNALYQVWDSRGRLWSVTDKGLLQHDGYQPVIFSPDKSTVNAPLSNELRALLKVQPDEFWISYKDRNDLSTFNPITNTYRHFLVDTLSEHGYPNAQVTKIIFENDSIRWVLTWGKGVCRLNIKNGFVTCYANDDNQVSEGEPPTNLVKEMVKLEADKYLVGFFLESDFATPHYFSPSTGKYTPMDLEPFLAGHDKRMRYLIKLALTMVNFIYLDADQNYWFGTYIGVIQLNLKDQTSRRISGKGNDLTRLNLENTRTYVIDQNGILWMSTPNQGIMLLDPATAETSYLRHNVDKDRSLSDDRLTSVAIDPLGNIWLATESGTFSICNPLTQSFQIHPWSELNLDFSDRSSQQIPVNQILVLPDGKILISNANGLISYDSRNAEVTTILDPRVTKELRDIYKLGIQNFRKRGNELFFVIHREWKNNVLFRYNLETGKLIAVEQKIRANRMLFRHANDMTTPIVLFPAWDGVKLMHFNETTNRVDSLTEVAYNASIAENFTLMLNSGKWMIPFKEGNFALLNPVTTFAEIYHRNSADHFFPDSTINCAYKEPSGIVWIGTQTAIYRFDETTHEVKKFNQQIGLGEKEKVNAITQDKNGIFWICLAKDMVRWDRNKNSLFRFNRSHGLNPGTFLPAVAQQDTLGNIYIACYNGILVFNPSKTMPSGTKPELYLASAFLNDSIPFTQNQQQGAAVFAHNENYFTFEFHTNEIFTLTPNTFYYRLLGRDENWQDNGVSNRIRLADLGPGEYTLEVKAVNTFDNESNVLQIPFVIARPFWQTWWFILVMVLLLGVVVWIYIRYREKALRKRSIELERTVHERTADVVREKKEADKQRLEAEHQKEIVEEKQKEISDSINYAKRIQNAILPSGRFFRSNLPDSFILYLPKDIVAGDFYFMEATGDTIIVAVADCTGHGVPGAMVSVVCHNALTRSVKEFGLTNPNEILDKTRELVLETFAKSEDQVNDGMDIAMCSINLKTQKLLFAGANNGLFLIRQNELLEFKPDKQPIGKFIHAKPFTAQEISLQPGDQFYLYSDGYADQFGGEAGKPGGKKFKYSRLKTLLQEIHLKNADTQHNTLAEMLVRWRGEIEQVDDVCIIGFKVS